MGNSYNSFQILSPNRSINTTSTPSLQIQAAISSKYSSPHPRLSQSELSLIDTSYYSFKPQGKVCSTESFSSIFWISRNYPVLMKFKSGVLTLKSEFDCFIPDEDCLTYFKTLNFLKSNVLDYSEKIQDDVVLVSLRIKKRILAKETDLLIAFKTYKSAGVYFVGRSFKGKSSELSFEVLGFSAVRDAANLKTRVFCLAQVERCDWMTRKWIISWFDDIVHAMHTYLSR